MAKTVHPKLRHWSIFISLLLTALVLFVAGSAFVGGPGNAAVGTAGAQRTDYPIRFLTDRATGDPLTIARNYIRAKKSELGLTDSDIADMVLKNQYRTKHNQVTHLYFAQRVAGTEVANALLNINVDREGRVINVGNRFARVVSSRRTADATLRPDEAVARAAAHLGLETGERPQPVATQRLTGVTVFDNSGVSQDEIPVKLAYFPTEEGGVRLAWDVVIRPPDNRHWWHIWVDAASGEVLGKHDWTGRYSGIQARRPAGEGQYRVFALPKENPYEGDRSVEIGPSDPTASPYGWHDVDGKPGADFTDTRGNNVFAEARVDGSRPDGGRGLVFDFPVDLTTTPQTYKNAAVVNAFYWMNLLHDIHYRYGFDEVAGNFQRNNYGRGGRDNDALRLLAQAGEMVTFSTPADGLSPISRIFIATPITAVMKIEHTVTINAPSGGDLPAAGAFFGPILNTRGLRGKVVQVNDGNVRMVPHPGGPPQLHAQARQSLGSHVDGCDALVNEREIRGNIALIESGNCSVITKVRNAQRAGATGVIIVNNESDELRTMGSHAAGDDVTIPSVMIRKADSDRIGGVLDRGVEVTLKSDNSTHNRDADFDSGVLIHEYGHGVASRLTGGPASPGCLQSEQSLGIVEGVGDFWALVLTAKRSDRREKQRSISTYVFFQPPDGPGVRGVPYSPDLKVNNVAFGDLTSFTRSGTTAMPHGTEGQWSNTMVAHAGGTIWASALWEVYWNLVEAHGFTPDLFNGKGGNTLMLQLVMDGLKLQPCNPTFVEARDAILLADMVNNRGANQCLIWRGFAKRGLGISATDGGSARSLNVKSSSDVPASCQDSRR